MTYMQVARLVMAEPSTNGKLCVALDRLITVAAFLNKVKDNMPCTCEKDGVTCPWCLAKRAIEDLHEEQPTTLQAPKTDVRKERIYWCCTADFPNHDDDCPNRIAGP